MRMKIRRSCRKKTSPRQRARPVHLRVLLHDAVLATVLQYVAHGMHPTCKLLSLLRFRAACPALLRAVSPFLASRNALVEATSSSQLARESARRLRAEALFREMSYSSKSNGYEHAGKALVTAAGSSGLLPDRMSL
jgi:hypothetical protein